MPAPGVAVAAAAGTFLDPLWVGIVAGLGSATGELSGYLLGYYGRRAVPTDTSRAWRLAERGFRQRPQRLARHHHRHVPAVDGERGGAEGEGRFKSVQSKSSRAVPSNL